MKGLLVGSLLIGIAFGATTYPIVEPDLLQEIESRKAVLQKKFLEAVAKSQGKALKPPEGWSVALPLAKKSKVRHVSLKWSSPYEIPRVDKSGKVVGVLYPKGYTFNPLDYVPMAPPTLIVFDGEDRRQVRIVEKLLSFYRLNTMLIASRGRVDELMKTFKTRVYFLNPLIKERFQITEGVSLITWDMQRKVAVVKVLGEDEL